MDTLAFMQGNNLHFTQHQQLMKVDLTPNNVYRGYLPLLPNPLPDELRALFPQAKSISKNAETGNTTISFWSNMELTDFVGHTFAIGEDRVTGVESFLSEKLKTLFLRGINNDVLHQDIAQHLANKGVVFKRVDPLIDRKTNLHKGCCTVLFHSIKARRHHFSKCLLINSQGQQMIWLEPRTRIRSQAAIGGQREEPAPEEEEGDDYQYHSGM